MKKLLRIALAIAPLIFAASADAQGPGPGPAPNPWVVNGATISYSNGGVLVGASVTGGTKGVGTINAAGLYVGGSNLLNQIVAGTYTGATSITTLGTITTGTWHGSSIGVAFGGTGATSLTANAFLTGNGTGGLNQVVITGLVLGNGASAPSAYAGTGACSAGQFLSALSAVGAGTCSAVSLPSDVVYTDQNQTFTKAQRSTPVALSISTSTFTPNFDTGQNFSLTLVHASCPCTFANPSTTPVAGQSGVIVVIQSATGSDTIGTWGSDYISAGGTSTIALSTAANAMDFFSYYVQDATHIVVSAGALNATH